MKKILKSGKFLKNKIKTKPKIAIVLGSGLNGCLDKIVNSYFEIDYKDIPYFPVPSIKGHKGKLIAGNIEGIDCIIMQGRVHFYEGNSVQKCVYPIRLMKVLGINTIVLTNSSGGINLNFSPGDIMLINDHILYNVPSPLIGENINELGSRFPDMTYVYEKNLQELADIAANNIKINLKKGVYLQCSGPQFETPAEIKMFRTMGADAVGMSTAIEAIASRHCNIKVLGLSCISNYAAGISGELLNSQDVNDTAKTIEDKFGNLLREIIKLYNKNN